MIPNVLNKEIFFDEPSHKYTDKTGKELISVTTLIKKFANSFDPQGFIVKACARKDNITVEKQLQLWEDNRKASSVKGKILHSDIENYINLGIIPDNCNKGYVEQFSKIKFSGTLQSEVLLYNLKYEIAGTTDLIEFTSKNTANIWDFKTNKELHWKNKYNKFMLSPFEHLNDINTVHYALQISIYSYLLEEMGYWTEKLNILYTNDITGQLEVIPIKYMPNEVKKILKYTKANPIDTSKQSNDLWGF